MGKWNEILLGFNFDVVTGMFGTTNLPAQPCLIPKMGRDQPFSQKKNQGIIINSGYQNYL